jgi:surface polysaccharide O-acyltransferase-like enzyme
LKPTTKFDSSAYSIKTHIYLFLGAVVNISLILITILQMRKVKPKATGKPISSNTT